MFRNEELKSGIEVVTKIDLSHKVIYGGEEHEVTIPAGTKGVTIDNSKTIPLVKFMLEQYTGKFHVNILSTNLEVAEAEPVEEESVDLLLDNLKPIDEANVEELKQRCRELAEALVASHRATGAPADPDPEYKGGEMDAYRFNREADETEFFNELKDAHDNGYEVYMKVSDMKIDTGGNGRVLMRSSNGSGYTVAVTKHMEEEIRKTKKSNTRNKLMKSAEVIIVRPTKKEK